VETRRDGQAEFDTRTHDQAEFGSRTDGQAELIVPVLQWKQSRSGA